MLKINHLRRFTGPVLGGRLGRAAFAGSALALVCTIFCACNGGGESRGNPAGQSAYACADSVEFSTMLHRFIDIQSVIISVSASRGSMMTE